LLVSLIIDIIIVSHCHTCKLYCCHCWLWQWPCRGMCVCVWQLQQFALIQQQQQYAAMSNDAMTGT